MLVNGAPGIKLQQIPMKHIVSIVYLFAGMYSICQAGFFIVTTGSKENIVFA